MTLFFAELRRRKVFRVVGSYAVIAWLIIQVIVAVEVPLGLPGWSDTVIIVALLLGFPVCAALAWVYDLTGQGIERTADVVAAGPGHAIAPADLWVIAASVSAAALLLITSAYLVIGDGSERIETLAVLPFQTAPGDGDTQYLGEGMRDSLIMRLSRLPALRI